MTMLSVLTTAAAAASAASTSADVLKCNHVNCPGGDIASANPLSNFTGGLSECAAACKASATKCDGWVYEGPEACAGSRPACWLKAAPPSKCAPSQCICASASASAPPSPPPPCTACAKTVGWIGGEWHPSNASNSLWMAPAFFDGYIESIVPAELGYARANGLTAIRVFLHNMAYEAGPATFLLNLDKLLAASAAHGIGVGFVFFDVSAHRTTPARAGRGGVPKLHR